MAVIDTTFVILHLLFAGLWTGSVVFFAWRIHPLAVAGDIGVAPTQRIVSGLQWLTRVGALVFLATGGHMAASRYEFSTLLGTDRGHLVVSMLVFWLVLTGLVEAAAGKMQSALDEGRLRTAGRETQTLFRVAGAVALTLLVLGGLLAA